MTTALTLVKSEIFEGNQADFYTDNDAYFMTSEQLVKCLGFASKSGISNVINRNEYLKTSEFSVVHKLCTTDGKSYNTRLFNEDGIYEIAFLSRTVVAQLFRAWVRKILKELRQQTKQKTEQLISSNPLLEQNILDLKHATNQLIEHTLENSYFIGEFRDRIEILESKPQEQFNPHTFNLMRQAIESLNQRYYNQEKIINREHGLFKQYIHGSDHDKQIASALLLDNAEYRNWVKQSVIKIASRRQVHTNTVYKDLYKMLRTNPETADTMNMWETALEEDNGLLYKTYNLFSDRPSRGKIIHNLMDAIVKCGESHTWELKDIFTTMIVCWVK